MNGEVLEKNKEVRMGGSSEQCCLLDGEGIRREEEEESMRSN